MLLSRRTFLQSCVTASVSLAAEAARTPWLLNPSDLIQVGIVGLGEAASEHLALYAAIPGVRIAHIADPSIASLASALAQLKELGRSAPRVSSCFRDLLADRTLHALSLPREVPAAGLSLAQAMDAGLPVLIDVPPPSLSVPLHPRFRKAPIFLRIGDFCCPGPVNLPTWLNRNTSFKSSTKVINSRRIKADLILQRGIGRVETRAVMISAVHTLVRSQAAPAQQLTSWASDPGTVEGAYGSPTARINLPTVGGGPAKLTVELFPRAFEASVLSLNHMNGVLELPIWPRADAQSSLCTVMRFLDSTRSSFARSSDFNSAVASSHVIDRLLRKLHVDL